MLSQPNFNRLFHILIIVLVIKATTAPNILKHFVQWVVLKMFKEHRYSGYVVIETPFLK